MNANEIMVCKASIRHESCPLADIRGKVKEICSPLGKTVRPGSRIAVAVGSRGVANIDIIVKAVVDFLKEAGALPFVVPAMGSHGGATAKGQAELLAGYGISESETGAEVLSSMDVEYLGETDSEEPFSVYMDKNAFHSDGVIAINRVKSHTDYHGEHESGIVKMLVIGLGKHKQAVLMHRFGAEGLRRLIPKAAEKVIGSKKIIGCVGILEDGLDNTADIVFAPPDRIFEVDGELLARSKELMAKLPFERIDTLIVDSMGKNISGTGMDTNVIGRIRIKGQQDAPPDCGFIVVLDLTAQSHGNATGMGLADITTRRFEKKIDRNATNANIITSGFLSRGFLPVVAETDLEAVEIAINGKSYTPQSIKLARIRDTLHLDEVYLSKALLLELLEKKKGEQLSEFMPLSFVNGEISGF